MSTVKRDQYCFTGPYAEKSAEFYDIVLSHGYSGDLLSLAWESAHKFGSRMESDGLISFSEGVIIGENALQAEEFIAREYRKAYDSCEEFGRRKKMIELKFAIYANAERQYGVKIKVL